MILIPVKNLSGAKQRLAGVLDQQRRTELARAMLEDVLAAVTAVPSRPPVMVVTSDAFAASLARRHGFLVLDDPENPGESGAIEMATRAAEAAGADFTLVLPGDIPLVTASEIRLVLDAMPERGTVFVRAADARGTNAVLRRPASLFPLRFGNDSFLPHLASARATGLPVEVREAPGIALDIDRPDDLARLLAHPVRTGTQRLLTAWHFSATLK
ncbi:MAG TPA: 2-phospho-L-lactate guanylyltransferase [Terriglobales bacterium]|nr:2-phospho-L-lactate guanylyltransferase [Terriglobales bacterium]